jgi:beta-N-acetylhexosaminidase
MTSSAAIYGCAGTVLGDAERRFFAEANPLGFILFGRNIEDPDQVRHLVAALRDCVGRADAPVLIDQEGGRVARLRPPHWRAWPAAQRLGLLASRKTETAAEASKLIGALIGAELGALGISVDCAPVLDLRIPGAHDVIGDRAYGADPETVISLGGAFADGLMSRGILPIMKHIPGHGRTGADSHTDLPRVSTSLAELDRSDFMPFRGLKRLPWAMTAHIVYEAVDPTAPATTSATVIQDIIRDRIGFDGLLLSDDLSMQALSGSLGERARQSLAAGCDVVLHCNGVMSEMEAVAAESSRLSATALRRIAAGAEKVKTVARADIASMSRRLDTLMGS